MGNRLRMSVAVGLLTSVLTIFAAEGTELTAYVGATIVDPGANVVIPNGVIVVSGNTIQAVGEARSVKIPKTAHVVRLRGKWIVPGYIDVHTHISREGDAKNNVHFFNDNTVWRRDATVPPELPTFLARHLRSGTTTILDIGGPEWTLSVRSATVGEKPWPRVLGAGPIIGTPRPLFGVEGDREGYKAISTPDEGRAAVRLAAALKPDMMKFYLVPAEQTGKPFGEFLPIFEASFDEAHKLGVRTTAHALRLHIAKMAIEAGVDTLAHGVMDAPVDDAFIQTMRQRGVVVAPTLMVLVGPPRTLAGTLRFTDEEKAWGDPDAIADLLEASERAKNTPPNPRRTLMKSDQLEVALRNTKALSDAGVALAVGTDAGLLGVLHGPSILHEFQLMNRAGMTAREVLTAATLGGAKFLGREADLGGLSPGKLADMVVLNADPLADIRNASRMHMVVVGGRMWKPEEILPVSRKVAPR
jgi:imidazolonepropionase-like amidohydrolase